MEKLRKITNGNLYVNVSARINNKIQYLCNRLPNNEWSGVLLFEEVEEDNLLNINVKDIILLDIGTQGSTEFEYNRVTAYGNEDVVIDYFEENPVALNYKMGLIHSHNNMKVYFSTIDIQELKTNTKCYEYYISVIVNNSNEFTAAVAYNIKKVMTGNKSVYLMKDGVESLPIMVDEPYNYEYMDVDYHLIPVYSEQPDNVMFTDNFFIKQFKNLMKDHGKINNLK